MWISIVPIQYYDHSGHSQVPGRLFGKFGNFKKSSKLYWEINVYFQKIRYACRWSGILGDIVCKYFAGKKRFQNNDS